MTIKKGDTIRVISGKDSGKQGTVERIIASTGKVIATGVNIRKHHFKQSKSHPKGGIIEMPGPLQRSNVMVVCPHCSKPTRIAQTISENTKYRSCVHCKASLDNN